MNEDKKLISYGSIYGENFGTGFAGNTWGVEGLCPTLKCESGGGNRVPLIVIGSTQRNAFIGDCSYCPTLTEAMGMGGGQIPMIVERNRDGDNTSRESYGDNERES